MYITTASPHIHFTPVDSVLSLEICSSPLLFAVGLLLACPHNSRTNTQLTYYIAMPRPTVAAPAASFVRLLPRPGSPPAAALTLQGTC